MKPPWPSTSSPATATEERVGHHHEQKESHRTPALKRSRNSLPSRRWEVANDGRPSTGAAPQLLPLPDLSSPSSSRGNGARSGQPQTTASTNTPVSKQKKSQLQNHLDKTKLNRRSWAHAKNSQAPPAALEHSTAVTKKGCRRFIPQRQRRLRLVAIAQDRSFPSLQLP